MLDRTFVTQMTEGSATGKAPILSSPQIIPWRREHYGLTDRQKLGVAAFTKRANALKTKPRKAKSR